MCTQQLLYPFTCGWTSGCFHGLATVNSVAVSTGVLVSFSVLASSGYVPTAGTVGSTRVKEKNADVVLTTS